MQDVIEGGANDNKRKFDVQMNKAILEEWDTIEKSAIILGASGDELDIELCMDSLFIVA